MNRAEVLTLFKRYGIEEIALHELSAREQVELVSRADLIVAEQGAGAAATAFASSDCPIIEIVNPHLMALFGPISFAAALAQPYARVTGRAATPDETAAAGLAPNPSDVDRDVDYVADTAFLARVLAAADLFCRQRI